MADVPRFPEVCGWVRRLLGSLVPAVRHVVLEYGLQRSGCLVCGIGPHATHECAKVEQMKAEEMEGAHCRRWMALVGQELLLFSSAGDTPAYKAGAAARIGAYRTAHRRPRFQRRSPEASPLASEISVAAQPGASPVQPGGLPQDSPPIPAAKVPARPTAQQATSPVPLGAPPRHSPPRPAAEVPARPSVKPAASTQGQGRGPPPVPLPVRPAVPPEQSAQAAPARTGSAPAVRRRGRSPPEVTFPPSPRLAGSGVLPSLSHQQSPSTPRIDPRSDGASVFSTPPRQPPGASSAEEPGHVPGPADRLQFLGDANELIEVILPPAEEWFVDSTSMDRLLPFVREDAPEVCGQMVLDVALARRIGVRRVREDSSPVASPQPNKARVEGDPQVTRVRKLYVPRRLLLESVLPAPVSEGSSSSSSSQAAPSSSGIDFNTFTERQYIHTPNLEHRRKFWELASAEAKARMTAHLQSLPPTARATVQAREEGWIPAL